LILLVRIAGHGEEEFAPGISFAGPGSLSLTIRQMTRARLPQGGLVVILHIRVKMVRLLGIEISKVEPIQRVARPGPHRHDGTQNKKNGQGATTEKM
jgi:hypothetical protein